MRCRARSISASAVFSAAELRAFPPGRLLVAAVPDVLDAGLADGVINQGPGVGVGVEERSPSWRLHDADEEPGISGGVVGKVPVHMGEVPDSRQIFSAVITVCGQPRAGNGAGGSRPGPWSAAGRGSAR